MATSLQELGRVVVQDILGDLCAEVFAILSTNGRSTRARLLQLSGLPQRQLKITLACMTQLHILLHQTTDDEQSFYQIDWRNTYSLIRSSRIQCLVEDRHGVRAGKVIAFLLQLGHARVQDLAEAFDLPSQEISSGATYENGVRPNDSSKDNSGKTSTIGQLHATIRKLLAAGLVVKVGNQAYTPTADIQAEIEELVISAHFPDRKVGGPKKQTEFRMAVNSMKRKRREAEDFSEQRDARSSGVNGRAIKRSKLNIGNDYGAGSGHDDSGLRLLDDLVLRVNYAQCTSALRSQCLEELAEECLGSATAAVYRALLRVLEGKQRARDDVIQPTEASDDEKDDHPIISTVEIADTLDSSINLDIFVAANDSRMTNGTEKAKQKTTQSAEDAENDAALGIVKREPLDSDDDHAATGFYSHRDRGLRLELIEEHLKLLDEHQLKFCERVGPAGRGEWRVDFTPLIDTLIQRNIDATIMSRLGPVHMRVVRMLRDKGRIDEKQIAAASMMRLKDVRSFLTQLQYAGFVESQDVPKDNQRQPSRTIFLYFYDRQRVQDQLLQRTYKSLSRMFQRLQLERQRYASAIEKAEKMDANQEALNQNEREAVMQWRAVEEKLLLQVDRLDSQVALLRDFSGRNVSLLS